MDSDQYCGYCCNDHSECECEIDGGDHEDIYFSEIETCYTKGCVIFGAHYSSECHTAQDAENYYKEIENAKTGNDF